MDRKSSQTPLAPRQPGAGNTPQPVTGAQSPEPQNHPALAASSSSSPRSQARNARNSTRRRGLGMVTPNACTECRKKRAKCDGRKPCGRCRDQKDVECIYETSVRQSKDSLRREIQNLRSRQRSSDQVLAALVRTDLREEVLRKLGRGQSVQNVSDWLGTALSSGDTGTSFWSGSDPGSSRNLDQVPLAVDTVVAQQPSTRGDVQKSNSLWAMSQAGSTRSNSYPAVMDWTLDMSGPLQTRVASWAESTPPNHISDSGMPRYRGLEQVLSNMIEPEMKTPPQSWTDITSDINLVQHLLALYFCWEYPTFASLSKEHFMQDFQNGRHRYCSQILVNALMALGCRFSVHPMTRANPNDPCSSGDHFFKESQRLLIEETDHHTLTTIQALGIMSIREASSGRNSESWYYAGQSIRLAVEMGLHCNQDGLDEDELAVQATTFWGAFVLDHTPHLPPKPGIIGNIEASLWVPYTDDGASILDNTPKNQTTYFRDIKLLTDGTGAPLQRSCDQLSNMRSVYKCFCELSDLVHQSLYILHSPGNPLTARELLKIYTQYLNWYDGIPEVLRLGHNFTPAVLFAHMYYHFAILLLFRPLIKLRIIGSKFIPKDVCSEAADAIQGLLTSYSQLYTLRRTPSFVPYFVLTVAIMNLAIGAASAVDINPGNVRAADIKQAVKIDPRVSEALKRGISDLIEMSPCHHFAGQALIVLQYLATKCEVEDDFDNHSFERENYDPLARLHTSSMSNVGLEDFISDWGSGRFVGSDQSSQAEKAAESLLNPLVWPFPIKGWPFLPTGKELEQAGFALLHRGSE
ncbi:hypothetical protein ACHAQJ_007946 [Trichoderma viride]